MNDPQRLIRLELCSLPSSVPEEVRLRRALKALRRAYRFRCVRARLVVDGVVQTIPRPSPQDKEH